MRTPNTSFFSCCLSHVSCLIGIIASPVLMSDYSQAQPLYSLGGKTVSVGELSPASQQELYEIQMESFEKTKQSVDSTLFENFAVEQAKKTGKSLQETQMKLLEVKDPSDKEVKSWFEENKSKIPPNLKFEDIKGEISKIVKQERARNKRVEAVEKIKKDNKFALLVAEPVAPILDVAVAGFPTKGKDAAKLTVVEFADYQCPHCKVAAEAFKKISERQKDKVKFVFIDYPVNPSGISRIIAEQSHCAAEQGKFWEFHYKAFDKQSALDASSGEAIANELKLDSAKFKKCVESGVGKSIVDKAKAEGDRIGVSGTPFILINGKRYIGPASFEALTKKIESLLKS
jgi:protein-disulfide isomerase